MNPIKTLVLLPKGRYGAFVRSVHDGDTMRVLLAVELPLRLDGIQAAELSTPKGKMVAQAVREKIQDKWVEVEVKGGYKYGANGERMGDIFVDGENLSEWLISQGLAVAWDGRGPRPYGAKQTDADFTPKDQTHD